jgi:hypothetical protein
MKPAFAILLLSVLAVPQFGQVTSLKQVKIVKIGSMGQSDEAERFRLLLDDELNKAGFITTEKDKDADAILTGALSVRTNADARARVRVTVVLKTADARRLGGKDFEPRYNLALGRDPVKIRAEDVAKTLRKDVNNAP